MKIRRVELADAEQIAEIYNYYILNTHHTFETEPLRAPDMLPRMKRIAKDYPFLVADDQGVILGYAYAAQFKLRDAYKYAAEVSVYVRNDAKQKGVGSQLSDKLFKEFEDTNIHAIIAGISLPNEPSVRFHEKFGFKKAAHFKEVGYKLGRWVDVGYLDLLNTM
jgi:phosphinothricin acetyltransferase